MREQADDIGRVRPDWARVRTGDPSAASAIWAWRDGAHAPPDRTHHRRLKGAAQGLVGIGFGSLTLWVWGHALSWVVVIIGSVVLLSALVSPDGVFARIERAVDALVVVVGKVTTFLVMVPLFYGIFLPFGLLFRRGRADALRRYTEPDAPTYWVDRADRALDKSRLF